MDYHASNVRNIAFIGHGGNGKTSLTEALLFLNGNIERLGKTDDGSTVSDYDPEEIKRHISISLSIAPVEFEGNKINILDCPGYFDFEGSVLNALNVADGAVIVASAQGVDVGTEKAIELAKKKRLPRIIFINQIDKEHTSFDNTVLQLKAKYGSNIVPILYPIIENNVMTGFVDLVDKKAYTFKGEKRESIEIPSDLIDTIELEHAALMETAAENDEELMEKVIMGEELTHDEIIKGLALGVADSSAVPVLCGSALDFKGVRLLQDTIMRFIPSSLNKEFEGLDDIRTCNEDEPFSAYVFKTISDPFAGKLSIFMVRSGVLTSDTPLYNANEDKAEKSGNIYILKGKNQIPVQKLYAGDIGAIGRLQYTLTGHTLYSGKKIQYESVENPWPGMRMAVVPKKQGDEDKVFSGLRKLIEEDNTISLEKNNETNEMILMGLGDMHLDITLQKLKTKYNGEAILKTPQVPYKETIRKSVKAQGKYKKQSGGHGQYGDCWIEFNPSDKEFEFIDKVVGGAVPRSYIPAVEKGLIDCMKKGVLAGYPVTGISCTLYDGSYHPVDSSEMAFKSAASIAYKTGCASANPVLLEPVYAVEITVPDDYMGDVIGDINKRRGRVLGMTPVASGQRIDGEVPLSEMFTYAIDLRAMTQGKGLYKMEFTRYEEVPQMIAQKIAAAVQKDSEE
ncbi:MAG: elongation factor G [Clostridiales bacterium]|nr:elongation factor G [Clostridiales bacterium]